MTRSAVGPTHPPIQWVREVLSPEVKRLERESNPSVHLVLRLRIGVGATRLLPHSLCLHGMVAFTLMEIIYLCNLIGLSLHCQHVWELSCSESGVNKRKYVLFMVDCQQIVI
jgi:hypothetical protein